MLINDENIKLTPNMEKISNILTKFNFKHFAGSPNTINLGINEGEYFVNIMIMDNQKLGRIVYYSSKKDLSFDNEMKNAVQDIISDINNQISYGHIVLNSTELGKSFALYKCFSSPDMLTPKEVSYNIKACNYMVHQYFDDFSHFA